MNTGTLNSAALNTWAVGGGGKNSTYTTDAVLVVVHTATYTTDVLLRGTLTRTYTTDALLQGGSTKFYSTDALLAIPFHDNGSAHDLIGNNRSRPSEPNRNAVWSTYTRPANPWDGQTGDNQQTGKTEHWDAKAGAWKNADGSLA